MLQLLDFNLGKSSETSVDNYSRNSVTLQKTTLHQNHYENHESQDLATRIGTKTTATKQNKSTTTGLRLSFCRTKSLRIYRKNVMRYATAQRTVEEYGQEKPESAHSVGYLSQLLYHMTDDLSANFDRNSLLSCCSFSLFLIVSCQPSVEMKGEV